MKKWLKILLSLNSLRKAFGYELFFAATKFNFHIQILEDLPSNQKVLILAPHPDDDCFGLGGTMAKIAQNSGTTTVAYFCDGSGGVESGAGNFDKNLIEIRKKEAKISGEILRVKEQVFFGYHDGSLASSMASTKALSDLIKRVQPDIIFVPSFLDNHPDHRVVNEILINALTNIDAGLEIWAYEIWTPLQANRIVMINSELEVKGKSMQAHVSQLKTRGYMEAILGLNQYRAEINNQKGYAEGFFAATPAIYKEMYRKS